MDRINQSTGKNKSTTAVASSHTFVPVQNVSSRWLSLIDWGNSLKNKSCCGTEQIPQDIRPRKRWAKDQT